MSILGRDPLIVRYNTAIAAYRMALVLAQTEFGQGNLQLALNYQARAGEWYSVIINLQNIINSNLYGIESAFGKGRKGKGKGKGKR
jgi:hypothetical protein